MNINLTTNMAEKLLEVVFSLSKKYNQKIAVSIFDQGGNLLAFMRDESVFLGAIDVSIRKAKTANAFRRSTQQMQNRLQDGKLPYLTFDQVLPLEGGIPIVLHDICIGGVGVSGAPSEIDHRIASEAVEIFAKELNQ